MAATDNKRAFLDLFSIGLVLAAFMGMAQAAGTPEQRRACTRDALKLCGEFVPNVERITACMKKNIRKLSPPCRAQFRPATEVKRQK